MKQRKDEIFMNNEPYITIGIASYNYGKYLKRAFDAIKKQSFKDFEVLYCDDASSDNSVEIIKSFINDNPEISIHLIEGEENLGVMENKNRILANARGKYILICDADDWMEDNCLDILAKAANETNADQIVAVTQNVTDDKIIQIQKIPKGQSKWTWGMHHGTLYKREIIKKNNLKFDKNAYPDDIYFNMIFHEKSGETVFLNDVVYNWYKHSDSASSSKAEKSSSSWIGCNALKNGLYYMKDVFGRHEDDDAKQIEYMAIKYYCLIVLHRSTNVTYKEFYQEYSELAALMLDFFPRYRHNKYAMSLTGRGVVRLPAAITIFTVIMFEKLHLIGMLLWCYWLFCKIFGINRFVD